MIEQCVKPWTFCFAFRKNNRDIKCALRIMSSSLLECVQENAGGPRIHI